MASSAFPEPISGIKESLLDATGDILYASADNTPVRLGIGSSAQVLTVAAGVPSWATPASGGLTLIRRATMSAVANSGTSFDGVFTTAYKTYQIVFEGFQSSGAGTEIRFNWRISGATQSGAAYNGNSVGWQHTGTFFSVPTAALTYFNVITTNNNSQHRAQGTLWAYQVGNTSETPAVGGVFHTSYSHGPVVAGCDYTAGNMDGFIITASTGTLTGTIAVYGLAI
jgi:hypothetical protein